MVYSDVLLIIRQEHVKQLFQCYLSISPLFKRKDTNVVQVFKYAPLVNPCVTETFPSYYLKGFTAPNVKIYQAVCCIKATLF